MSYHLITHNFLSVIALLLVFGLWSFAATLNQSRSIHGKQALGNSPALLFAVHQDNTINIQWKNDKFYYNDLKK